MVRAEIILMFAAMGVVTYLPRALPMVGLSRLALPKVFLTWLSMVPAAVLAALAAQSLVVADAGGLRAKPLELAVAVPCLILALKTKSMVMVSLAGMGLMVLGRSLGLG